MAIVHITDHADRAEGRLVAQYKGKPNMVAAVRIFATELQAAEDALFGLLAGRALASAEGVQLDGLGRLAGIKRDGRDDDTYQLYISVERLLNRSSAGYEELLKIFGLLAAPLGLSLVLEEQLPAALVLRTTGGALVPFADFINILRKAKAAGVRSILEFIGTAEASAFVFAGGAGLGFDTLTNPGIGGSFAEAVE
jgi:hypothetical protein